MCGQSMVLTPYAFEAIMAGMSWEVRFDDAFDPEFDRLSEGVQDEIYSRMGLLRQFGPQLGRPNVDTLDDSKFPNMKELRFNCEDGKWRVAFAFDPKREGILLCAGDKMGADQEKFYKDLIKLADQRFSAHLEKLKQEEIKAKQEKARESQGKAKRK